MRWTVRPAHRILRRTYDTIRLVNEAGTQEFGKMCREAQALLPFVMLKVWGAIG